MRRREPHEEALDQLGSEARSVLAVLVMAALWPERYSGGWIPVSEFGRAGVLLGERAGHESLKAAIRRGLRQVAQVPGVPPTECRRAIEPDDLTGRIRRDRDRRLAGPAGPLLEGWLLRNGPGLISSDIWGEFFPVGSKHAAPGSATARDLLRQSLRQAQSCLGFAALSIPRETREGRTLNRILGVVNAGIREIASHRSDI
jgi:hypothetical protein